MIPKAAFCHTIVTIKTIHSAKRPFNGIVYSFTDMGKFVYFMGTERGRKGKPGMTLGQCWMDENIQARLSALPPLNRANALAGAQPCKICGYVAPFFDVVDFHKRPSGYPFGASGIGVPYFRCPACGFLFAVFCDNWTADDFARYIYNSDYVLVDAAYRGVRPTRTAEQISRLLADHKDAPMLDYGAGGGIFAARMNDKGFRVTAYDPFSAPLRPTGKFRIITCFEVVEHSPSPIDTFAEMAALLEDDGCMIVGQPFQPADIDAIRCSWWYISPRNGHVSAYTDRTFALIARKFGMNFYRGKVWHVFIKGDSDHWDKIAMRLGQPLRSLTLGASKDGPFLPPEGAAAERFQWTNDRTVTWHQAVSVAPGLVCQIVIPFARQPRPGFANECSIVVNGTGCPVEVRGDSILLAESPAAAPEIAVTLQMPELVPVRGQGSIGLALRVLPPAYQIA